MCTPRVCALPLPALCVIAGPSFALGSSSKALKSRALLFVLCLMEKLLRDPSFQTRRWAKLRGVVIVLEGVAVHCHLAL